MKQLIDNADLPMSKAPGQRAQQRAETRAAILDASIALFAQMGFDGTALPAVTKASGIPVPLIIYHFNSKELLWRAAVDEVYARLGRHLEMHRSEIESAVGVDFYRACARAHITALAAHPEYMRILFQEGTQNSDRLEWLVETHQSRMSGMLKAIIARAQDEGLVPAMDLDHAKFVFSGAFCLPIVLAPEYRITTGKDSTAPDFIERHIDICLRLLLPSVDWNEPR